MATVPARLSIGTDPEFMLTDRKGQYLSAIPIVKHDKEDRMDLGNDHKMFYDNVLAEFNVKASYSEEELIINLTDCFKRATKKLAPYLMKPQASQMFPPSECLHPDALRFGCEPEYCAYDVTIVNPPTCEKGNSFRSAGGHIHLGYDKDEWPLIGEPNDACDRDWGKIWVIRMMDLFVGLPSLLVDHDETSKKRRQLYGKAGTHRPKDYGVEYRATSNFWLASPKLTRLVYKLSAFSVDFVKKNRHLELWKDNENCKAYNAKVLRNIIDNSDINKAKCMMEELIKPILPKELYGEIFKFSDYTTYNFYREWQLV